MRRLVIGAALASVIAAGCAREERPPPAAPTRPPPVVVPPPGPAAPTALSYVATASSVDRFMIAAAELAQARARDPRLRDFAGRVKRSHEAISAQLSFAGRRLNLLPSGRMGDHHSNRLRALQAAADFDSAYRSEMMRTHQAALEHHRRYARDGESPTLKPVARFAADTISDNLQALRSL